METAISFDKVKSMFLDEAPRLLHRRVDGSVFAHLAAFENVARWRAENPDNRGRSPAKIMWLEAMREIRKVVAWWDVRRVGDLVALAPHAFPAWVAGGRYGVELGESGWVLVKTA